jgi:hypothetical protein
VLDYQNCAHTLLPLVASAYALHFMGNAMMAMYRCVCVCWGLCGQLAGGCCGCVGCLGGCCGGCGGGPPRAALPWAVQGSGSGSTTLWRGSSPGRPRDPRAVQRALALPTAFSPPPTPCTPPCCRDFEKEREAGRFGLLPELHALSSGMKAVCTWITADGIEECRRAAHAGWGCVPRCACVCVVWAAAPASGLA